MTKLDLSPTYTFSHLLFLRSPHIPEKHILINLYFLTGHGCVKNFYPCLSLHFEGFVTVIEMFPTVSQFPQHDEKEAEDSFNRMRQIKYIANFLGFLNLNINPKDTFKNLLNF